MPKFDVKVKLVGNDGNAFAIMGAVSRGIKRAGGTQKDVDEFHAEAMSGDYDNLLRAAMEWVEVL